MHLDRWPAWAAVDHSAKPEPPPEQLCPEDPTIDVAPATAAEPLDRARTMVVTAPCAPTPRPRPYDPDWIDSGSVTRERHSRFGMKARLLDRLGAVGMPLLLHNYWLGAMEGSCGNSSRVSQSVQASSAE